MRAEKLETQKGIRNNRNVCQRPSDTADSPLMLKSNAIPTIALIPKELSQIRGEASKCATTVTEYQIR